MVEDTPRAINRENIRLVKAVELINITLQALRFLPVEKIALEAMSYS